MAANGVVFYNFLHQFNGCLVHLTRLGRVTRVRVSHVIQCPYHLLRIVHSSDSNMIIFWVFGRIFSYAH